MDGGQGDVETGTRLDEDWHPPLAGLELGVALEANNALAAVVHQDSVSNLNGDKRR